MSAPIKAPEPNPKQAWPHAYWSLFALALLVTFSWYFEDVQRVDGVREVTTDWRGLVFAVLLAFGCAWSFVRCPGRNLLVKLVTLVCLVLACCLAAYSMVSFFGKA